MKEVARSGLEIDVHPLNALLLGSMHGPPDQFATDGAPPQSQALKNRAAARQACPIYPALLGIWYRILAPECA
jgi:hypothetical protein